MSIYIVVIEKGRDAVVAKLKQYADCYAFNKNTYFIRTDDSAEYITDKIGFRGKNTGFVFRLNSAYSGYTQTGLWEWLYNEKAA